MDKQKQILSNHEEISELANALYGMQGEFDMSNPYEVGYVLINKLGYRKIPENAVVLTDDEYERWQGQTLNIKKVRKETAEKFAERLSEEDCSIPIKDDFIIITRKDIDEICKEFTGRSD